MSRQKLLRTELSTLEKNFPKTGDDCFQIVIASPEELVCRFIDLKSKRRFTLQCNISVSSLKFRLASLIKSVLIDLLAQLPSGHANMDHRIR